MTDSDSATAQSPSPSPPAAPLAPVYFYFLLAPAFNPLSSPYVSHLLHRFSFPILFFAVSSRLQRKENLTPVGSKIAELNESRVELLTRIQGLKQDLHTWRSKLDTQIKVYREELTEVKKSLNDEVEQLRLEFKELRTTLQQQQDDISSSMKNLGPVDGGEDEVKEAKHSEADVQQEDEAKVLTVEEEPSSA
ncbi:unnamed protein product [Linum tenue]|uniref:CAP-Gly domain-containing linker protein 1 n=1 Tax=Linum tenue TaxID=586396 RepID=A0AAV0P870_9ROSI|nr:unnamed protein product [Linum tenue]